MQCMHAEKALTTKANQAQTVVH